MILNHLDRLPSPCFIYGSLPVSDRIALWQATSLHPSIPHTTLLGCQSDDQMMAWQYYEGFCYVTSLRNHIIKRCSYIKICLANWLFPASQPHQPVYRDLTLLARSSLSLPPLISHCQYWKVDWEWNTKSEQPKAEIQEWLIVIQHRSLQFQSYIVFLTTAKRALFHDRYQCLKCKENRSVVPED